PKPPWPRGGRDGRPPVSWPREGSCQSCPSPAGRRPAGHTLDAQRGAGGVGAVCVVVELQQHLTCDGGTGPDVGQHRAQARGHGMQGPSGGGDPAVGGGGVDLPHGTGQVGGEHVRPAPRLTSATTRLYAVSALSL